MRSLEIKCHGEGSGDRSARRIVIIIPSWSLSGAPQAAARLARELRKRGHDAELWCLYRRRGQPPPSDEFCVVLADREISPLGYWNLPWLVLNRMRRVRPQTVISFSPVAHLLGQGAGLLLGVRGRLASHRIVCDRNRPSLRWLDMVFGSIGLYTRIIAVSEAVKASVNTYPRSYRRRVEVIHNGVERVLSRVSRAEGRAMFGLPGDADIVLALGRLAEQKNYPLLIDAVSRLPEVHLVIAGDGEERQHLERYAGSLGMSARLHLLGHVEPEPLSNLFRACDLFAFPSVYEGQSNALLEAMAEGMPIIASDIPEQAETLRDHQGSCAGILLPTGDPQRWATEIRRTLDDPVLRDSLGAAARQRAGYFTMKRMIDRFEAVACGC